MRIPLSQPDIGPRELELVNEVVTTGRLALGPMAERFERAVADFVGAGHAIAVASGTSALQVALQAAGVRPGDEVITTPFSFVASANVIMHLQATPVFVDVDPATWNMDLCGIEAVITPKTRAILPVHVFGQPCPMDRIVTIAEKHGLIVIEDACEALGSRYQGQPAGTFGVAGTFAFYPNKQITTGEGGMVVTNDAEVANTVRSLSNQGRPPSSARWLEHERLGYNYRIPELSCAVGVAQMERVEHLLANRAKVAGWYGQRLGDEPRLMLQKIAPEAEMSWFVMVVRLAGQYGREDRNRILHDLHELGIECSDYFPPIHLQPFYRQQFGYAPGAFPVCEALSDRTLAVPFHGQMTEAQVTEVCEQLIGVL